MYCFPGLVPLCWYNIIIIIISTFFTRFYGDLWAGRGWLRSDTDVKIRGSSSSYSHIVLTHHVFMVLAYCILTMDTLKFPNPPSTERRTPRWESILRPWRLRVFHSASPLCRLQSIMCFQVSWKILWNELLDQASTYFRPPRVSVLFFELVFPNRFIFQLSIHKKKKEYYYYYYYGRLDLSSNAASYRIVSHRIAEPLIISFPKGKKRARSRLRKLAGSSCVGR